jgi:hypothetical protein
VRHSLSCQFPGFNVPLTFMYTPGSQQGLMVGNAGTTDLFVWEGQQSISFMEALPTGAVQTMTVQYNSGIAVYSRHSIIGGSFSQSQVIGNCLQTD